MREQNLGESQGVRTLETDIRRGLHELGRQTLCLKISYAEGVGERRLACECGGRLEYQRRCEAQVLSVCDWVKYERSYYADSTCGKGKALLDGRFGLQAGQVTAGMADLLAMKGGQTSLRAQRVFSGAFFILSSIREHGPQGNRVYWAVANRVGSQPQGRQTELGLSARTTAFSRPAPGADVRRPGWGQGAH